MEGAHWWTDRPPGSPMSIHNTDHDGPDANEKSRRYAELTIGDDEFVIYDRQNHQAWIQSDVAEPLDKQC